MSKDAFKSHTWWRLSNGELVREELVVWSHTEDLSPLPGQRASTARRTRSRLHGEPVQRTLDMNISA